MTETKIEKPIEKMCLTCAKYYPIDKFLSKTNKIKNRCCDCRSKILKATLTYYEKIGKRNKGYRETTFCKICNSNVALNGLSRHLTSVRHRLNEYKNQIASTNTPEVIQEPTDIKN